VVDLPAWTDSVLATPLIGVRFEPWIPFARDVWSGLDRAAARFAQANRRWELQSENPTSVSLALADGVTFNFDPQNIVANFSYRLAFAESGGAIPQIAPVGVRPYSELAAALVADLELMIDSMLPQEENRRVRQIGVVAICHLVRSRLPPGVEAMVRLLATPWRDLGLDGFNSTLTARLAKAEDVSDRCHHAFVLDEQRPESLRVQLDWQRVFREPRTFRAPALKTLVREAHAAATAYFERFGSGELDFGSA
jgi:hypothetical protein